MSDGFGLVNPILSPILERVVREERLGRDHPRKKHDGKSERAREESNQTGAAPDQGEEAKSSMSSTHIDLRV